MRPDIGTRFWAKVDASGDCWEWQAQKSNGYGRFRPFGRSSGWMQAHRFAYQWLVGHIPDALVIDHLCRNRACVNPAHLQVVTQQENILRGQGRAARAARKTTCPRGHEYDSINTRGWRTCTVCRNATQARYVARKNRADERVAA